MITYAIYTVVALILVFVIYLALKAIHIGIEEKNKNKKLRYNLKNKKKY